MKILSQNASNSILKTWHRGQNSKCMKSVNTQIRCHMGTKQTWSFIVDSYHAQLCNLGGRIYKGSRTWNVSASLFGERYHTFGWFIIHVQPALWTLACLVSSLNGICTNVQKMGSFLSHILISQQIESFRRDDRKNRETQTSTTEWGSETETTFYKKTSTTCPQTRLRGPGLTSSNFCECLLIKEKDLFFFMFP